MLWNGADFTADGHEPVTGEEFYRIGLRCWGSEQYRPAAAFFLEHAAARDHAVAAELLGHVCFLQGDFAKAVPWLRRSPDSPRAAYYLGTLCQRGCPEAGLPQSFDSAAHWYRHAASLGEPEAMLALGDLYFERLLPPTRAPVDHALEYFVMAAAKGHPYAQYRAADLYRAFHDDLDRATAYYRQCLANPATPSHPLSTLMTLQSQAALRDIQTTRTTRAHQHRRDTVDPRPPGDTAY